VLYTIPDLVRDTGIWRFFFCHENTIWAILDHAHEIAKITLNNVIHVMAVLTFYFKITLNNHPLKEEFVTR